MANPKVVSSDGPNPFRNLIDSLHDKISLQILDVMMQKFMDEQRPQVLGRQHNKRYDNETFLSLSPEEQMAGINRIDNSDPIEFLIKRHALVQLKSWMNNYQSKFSPYDDNWNSLERSYKKVKSHYIGNVIDPTEDYSLKLEELPNAADGSYLKQDKITTEQA